MNKDLVQSGCGLRAKSQSALRIAQTRVELISSQVQDCGFRDLSLRTDPESCTV